MQSNFNAALQHVLEDEGGFSNHPKDPGGATMKGVTLETYRLYKKNQHLTAEDLKKITNEELRDIYYRRYWNAVKGDDLPSGLDYCVFDCAVNSGPGRAAKFLQEVVGVKPDGGIGPLTLAAVKAHCVTPEDTKALISTYADKRLQFWQGLTTFATFGRGWTRRGNEVKDAALAMV